MRVAPTRDTDASAWDGSALLEVEGVDEEMGVELTTGGCRADDGVMGWTKALVTEPALVPARVPEWWLEEGV